MMLTILAAIAFVVGFLGVAYLLALGLTKAILAHQERKEKAQRSAEYWALRTRSSYRAF
ncbi:hypothetical protein [Ruixingdingia sedimenti]|uniref:Uncharacterized protein n=1 Tax=Ruixingdingia sedimenti TaxID=3073604 RepID=A0ABU1FEL2_9RHOB|nr:hypothetical protein [Xinfangfangia sp. LG-4]MDR5655301.1 hypothetical protein [Xinfangfangia sp. LG-4]